MTINISYQTLHLPPPYAFAYTLDLEFGKELKVEFNLEYLNRDTLTEEEIQNEGYTVNDDFQWTGSLGEVWIKELKSDLSNLSLAEQADSDPVWIYAKIDNSREGNITNLDEWDFRLQELIQAIYEKSGRELPLKLTFIYILDGKQEFYELDGSFEHRTCKINRKNVSWQELQSLMSMVFSLDFDDEFVEAPKTNGLWVDPDGQSGYQPIDQLAGKKGKEMKRDILKILR